MKTCQGTGYFQQVQLRLLLCFISSVVFASSAFAFTAPNINHCYDCHGSPIIPNGTDIRPVDAAWRNITTGGVIGSHQKHIPSTNNSIRNLYTLPWSCSGLCGPSRRQD